MLPVVVFARCGRNGGLPLPVMFLFSIAVRQNAGKEMPHSMAVRRIFFIVFIAFSDFCKRPPQFLLIEISIEVQQIEKTVRHTLTVWGLKREILVNQIRPVTVYIQIKQPMLTRDCKHDFLAVFEHLFKY